MNTMKWLLKREFWEHKGGLFWAPIVVGAIMSLFIAATVLFAISNGDKQISINGQSISSLAGSMSDAAKSEATAKLAGNSMGFSIPFTITLPFVVFFFCLNALFDERKDKSILFWKSLPVSDSTTVLSKVITAIFVAPIITYLVAVMVSILASVIVCFGALMMGVNIFGAIFTSSQFYLSPIYVATALPIYALWALPTVGWLLMVGAWARTKPFLWAVGLPLLVGGLASWFNKMFSLNLKLDWLWRDIIARGLLSVAPGGWLASKAADQSMSMDDQPIGLGTLLTLSWQQLASPNIWIGAAVGAAMIYAAIRLRRWKDEG